MIDEGMNRTLKFENRGFIKDFYKILLLLYIFTVKIPLDFHQSSHYVHVLSSVRLQPTSTRKISLTPQTTLLFIPLSLTFSNTLRLKLKNFHAEIAINLKRQ